ncbi:hypothetical protein HMPREF1548_04025 [Clostridium sp. KLE 1755]|nr:hypothetical protein HMPREF1548_04025 [Clostridium sp. KLE 1755]
MKREHFSSRLGFILLTAACSIGLGNIWRFPYITGKYGGASFVICYLFFSNIGLADCSNGICGGPGESAKHRIVI